MLGITIYKEQNVKKLNNVASSQWTAAARTNELEQKMESLPGVVVCTHAAGGLSLDHVGLLRCYQLVCWLLYTMYIYFFHLNLGYSHEYP
jgi:hypothetical protein